MWRWVSACVVMIWLGFVVAFALNKSPTPVDDTLQPVAPPMAGEDWAGIYQGKDKIGFTRTAVQPRGDGFAFAEESTLRLKVLDRPQMILVHAAGEADKALHLRSFEFELGGSAVALHARGKVVGDDLVIDVDMGSQRSTLRIPQQQGLTYPGLLRQTLRGDQLKPGNRLESSVFDPMTMSTKRMSFEVVRSERVPETKPPVTGWRVRSMMADMQSTVWLDDDGNMIREEAPMGFVMVREAPDVAVNRGWSANGAADVARNAAVPVKGDISDPRNRQSLHLRLVGVSIAIPADAQQQVKGEEVLIRRAELSPGATFTLPYQHGDLAMLLADNAFVQSAHPKIHTAAVEVIGQERDAQRAAASLNAWVYGHLRKVPTVSLPNALEVLERGEGDCNEHAVLLMALTRSVGIPTRLAAGLVYVDGEFLYHAWNEVWLGGWVPIDSALGQFPADATHVKLAAGEVDAMFAVVQSIGQLSIEVVDAPQPG